MKYREVIKYLEGLFPRFCKAESRINDDVFNAVKDEIANLVMEIILNILDEFLISRLLCHRLRIAPHVHQNVWHLQARHRGKHLRVEFSA